MIDVVFIEACYRNTTVRRHVHAELVLDAVHHIRREACVCEHTNLLEDVRPVVLATRRLQFVNELDSESTEASSHL